MIEGLRISFYALLFIFNHDNEKPPLTVACCGIFVIFNTRMNEYEALKKGCLI